MLNHYTTAPYLWCKQLLKLTTFSPDIGLSLIKDPKSFCHEICNGGIDNDLSGYDLKMKSTYADIGSNNANPNPGKSFTQLDKIAKRARHVLKIRMQLLLILAQLL